jgi:hypothetical protein
MTTATMVSAATAMAAATLGQRPGCRQQPNHRQNQTRHRDYLAHEKPALLFRLTPPPSGCTACFGLGQRHDLT